MAKLARRIQDDEMSQGKAGVTAKTQTERPALSPVCEDRKTILMPQEQYQALVDLLDSPLTPEEIKGRKRLEAVPEWER